MKNIPNRNISKNNNQDASQVMFIVFFFKYFLPRFSYMNFKKDGVKWQYLVVKRQRLTLA